MWIYKKSEDNSARYILGEPGIRTLVCIGVNPSTAEPENLDNTLTNVRSISRKNGFDGWMMINLYPQRSTEPKLLHKRLDENLHFENLKYIKEYFTNCPPTDIWASWGVLIKTRSYLKTCLNDIYNLTDGYNPNWITLGKRTKDGHPHHPLYISHKEKFSAFEIKTYISGF